MSAAFPGLGPRLALALELANVDSVEKLAAIVAHDALLLLQAPGVNTLNDVEAIKAWLASNRTGIDPALIAAVDAVHDRPGRALTAAEVARANRYLRGTGRRVTESGTTEGCPKGPTTAPGGGGRQQGRGGMGSHKHGVSGRSGPSPRYKLGRVLDDAKEKAELPQRPRNPMHGTVADAFKKKP